MKKSTVIRSQSITFALVFLILAISSVVSTINGWFNSVDVRGWWPFGITIYLLVDFIYALVFSALTHARRQSSFFFAVAYNTTLGALLVVHSILFYATKPGSGHWEEFIHSSYTLYGAYGVFLTGAAIWSLTRRTSAAE